MDCKDSLEYLLHRYTDLSSDFLHQYKKPGMAVYSCNLSVGKGGDRDISGACWPSAQPESSGRPHLRRIRKKTMEEDTQLPPLVSTYMLMHMYTNIHVYIHAYIPHAHTISCWTECFSVVRVLVQHNPRTNKAYTKNHIL